MEFLRTKVTNGRYRKATSRILPNTSFRGGWNGSCFHVVYETAEEKDKATEKKDSGSGE